MVTDFKWHSDQKILHILNNTTADKEKAKSTAKLMKLLIEDHGNAGDL